jgi:recombination protein RecA
MDKKAILDARLQAHRESQPSRKEYLEQACAQSMGSNQMLQASLNKLNRFKVCSPVSQKVDIGLFNQQGVSRDIALSTGILSLDYALGGGLVSGTAEIYGAESIGKTTLGCSIARSAQKEKKPTLWCASEAFDAPYVETTGVNLRDLWLFRARYLEDLIRHLHEFFREVPQGVAIIDSATSFRPKESNPNSWHQIMANFVKSVRIPVGSVLVMINQVRAKYSKDPTKTFAGGTDSAARQSAEMINVRMELLRDEVHEQDYQLVINVIANPLKQPAALLNVPVVKGKGIDWYKDLVRVASEIGIVGKIGSYYYFRGTMIGHGEESAARHLERAPVLQKEIFTVTEGLMKGRA